MKLNDRQDTLNINALCFIFNAWCSDNNLPHLSADELLWEDSVEKTKEQLDFIKSFIAIWDYATNLEVQAMCKMCNGSESDVDNERAPCRYCKD